MGVLVAGGMLEVSSGCAESDVSGTGDVTLDVCSIEETVDELTDLVELAEVETVEGER
jgi:hypothetical protein